MKTPLLVDADLESLRPELEARLVALLPAAGREGVDIPAAMQAAVLTAGKRLRPLLMLLVGQALGARGPGLMDLACAVEMVHCASLVLDDMPSMDNARLRRGEPTVHLRFGEDVALLAAVALVSEACRITATASSLPASTRARATQVLCEAIGPAGLVRGQYRDLREGAASRSVTAVRTANEQKTGVLFAAALELAARAAGKPAVVPVLRRASLAIGQAFQLRDDLEDLLPAGDGREDALQDAGKSTVVQLLGAEAVRRSIQAQLSQARKALREALGREDARLTLLLAQVFSDAMARPAAAASSEAVDTPAAVPATAARRRAGSAWRTAGSPPLTLAN